MRIAIVGNGNVATVLGRSLKAAGHPIEAVIGRNTATGLPLANELNTRFQNIAEPGPIKCELVLLAIADNALESNLPPLETGDAIWAHTAGSVSIDVLKGHAGNYGVFYPLQSIHKNKLMMPGIPFLVDGVNELVRVSLSELAKTISSDVSYANDTQRLQYHLAAVLVSNFTNHLYRLAQDYLESQSLNFKILQPLIEETVDRLQQYKAREVQTGPAVRGDAETIAKHLRMLENHPEIKALYSAMSESIYKVNNSPMDYI